MKEILLMIAQTLRDTFADKNSLDGFEDWDRIIGCVITLEKLANSIEDNNESEVVNNG